MFRTFSISQISIAKQGLALLIWFIENVLNIS